MPRHLVRGCGQRMRAIGGRKLWACSIAHALRLPASLPYICAALQVPVLVARYGGTAQLASRVEAAVRAQQNNDAAVAQGQAAAAILERVVVHVSFWLRCKDLCVAKFCCKWVCVGRHQQAAVLLTLRVMPCRPTNRRVPLWRRPSTGRCSRAALPQRCRRSWRSTCLGRRALRSGRWCGK